MPLLTCPNCNVGMQENNRNGILIDVCPQCRSVWLDRGELEKILNVGRHIEQDYSYQSAPQRGYYPKPYKKKHWLLDILD